MATINELIKTNKKVANAVQEIIESQKLKVRSNEKKAEGQSIIIPFMKENEIKSEKVNGYNFSYVSGGIQNSFDKDRAKELLLEWGFDKDVIEDVWKEASKQGKRSEALRVS